MSIQSEIDRLAQAKQTIAQAIEDKGVEVPADATLDKFHAYIGNIMAASGIGENLGSYMTKGGVIDALVSFGDRVFSGLAAVSDVVTVMAVGSLRQYVAANFWTTNNYSSSSGDPTHDTYLKFKAEAGGCRMTWVISPDASLGDREFTIYGFGHGGDI